MRIYGVILEVIGELRPFVGLLERTDADLARQARRALASVALNCAEGMGSRGRLRGLRFHSALGSAKESMACVDVGVALHGLGAPEHATLEKLRHVIGALTILSR
jgi:four helix bundle protein